MSSTHCAHAYLDTSLPAVDKNAVKGPRSALSSRNTGSNKIASKGNRATKNKLEKDRAGGKQYKEAEQKDQDLGEEEKDEMGTSFLQYCATCETQIVVPNNSILYCSESCRLKDGTDAPAVTPYLSLFNKLFPSNAIEQDSDLPLEVKVRHILCRQEMACPSIAQRIPPFRHEGKADLDPSEWKPKKADRPSSEASRYLGQFHRSPATLSPIRRPTLQPRSTLASVAITTPSLSHTPATSTSSEESIAGTPYEFVTRPLLPRLDPKSCASAGIRSVDLVTPHILSAIPTPTDDGGTNVNLSTRTTGVGSGSSATGDVRFEKKWIVERSSVAVGSLKTLLQVRNSSEPIIPQIEPGHLIPAVVPT